MTENNIGVTTLLFNAATKRNDGGYIYSLSGGDLSTMARHATYLKNHGFDIGFLEHLPGLKTREEKKASLQALYDNWVPGWWSYRRDLIEYGICTEEEYRERVRR